MSLPAAIKFVIRRFLSQIARFILRRRSQPFPIAAAARTLILAPHQDDETLGCGGIIPQIIAAGHQVSVTYITDGSGSHPGHPGLAQLRRTEAITATTLLGLPSEQLEFLNVRDGSLSHLSPAETVSLTGKLAATLTRIEPTLVMLPCRADGSSEHDAAFGLFAQALALTELRPQILEFPVWSWWNPLLLKPVLRKNVLVWHSTFADRPRLKRQALAAYASQTKGLPPEFRPLLTPEFLSFFSSTEDFFFEWRN